MCLYTYSFWISEFDKGAQKPLETCCTNLCIPHWYWVYLCPFVYLREYMCPPLYVYSYHLFFPWDAPFSPFPLASISYTVIKVVFIFSRVSSKSTSSGIILYLTYPEREPIYKLLTWTGRLGHGILCWFL